LGFAAFWAIAGIENPTAAKATIQFNFTVEWFTNFFTIVYKPTRILPQAKYPFCCMSLNAEFGTTNNLGN
jgi:hypothetical protein